MQAFLIFVNIAAMDVKSDSELTLIVPAPPGLLNEVAPQIKQAFLAGESGAGDGLWTIQLRTDKKPREYKVVRVITVPEGAGAFAAYRFTQDGDIAPLPDGQGGDLLAGRVAVLDLGAGTDDLYTVTDGNFNPETILHATDDKAGIIHNLLRPILGDVMAAVPNATHLTTSHIDSYLRRYLADPTPENATLRVSGKNVNIEPSIFANCERYAEWISSNKVDPIFASGIDALVMAGGGWLYIASWIRNFYPNRIILSPDQFKHTKGIALYDLNGIGQLSLAAAVFRSQQA
jgi:hypothetical protein